jgi:hypothetical protein
MLLLLIELGIRSKVILILTMLILKSVRLAKVTKCLIVIVIVVVVVVAIKVRVKGILISLASSGSELLLRLILSSPFYILVRSLLVLLLLVLLLRIVLTLRTLERLITLGVGLLRVEWLILRSILILILVLILILILILVHILIVWLVLFSVLIVPIVLLILMILVLHRRVVLPPLLTS